MVRQVDDGVDDGVDMELVAQFRLSAMNLLQPNPGRRAAEKASQETVQRMLYGGRGAFGYKTADLTDRPKVVRAVMTSPPTARVEAWKILGL
jgi:hypothetical protein